MKDPKCPNCGKAGYHLCTECGAVIMSEECEDNSGLCVECYRLQE